MHPQRFVHSHAGFMKTPARCEAPRRCRRRNGDDKPAQTLLSQSSGSRCVSSGLLTTWWLLGRRAPDSQVPRSKVTAAQPFGDPPPPRGITQPSLCHLQGCAQTTQTRGWGSHQIPTSSQGHVEKDHVGWETRGSSVETATWPREKPLQGAKVLGAELP